MSNHFTFFFFTPVHSRYFCPPLCQQANVLVQDLIIPLTSPQSAMLKSFFWRQICEIAGFIRPRRAGLLFACHADKGDFYAFKHSSAETRQDVYRKRSTLQHCSAPRCSSREPYRFWITTAWWTVSLFFIWRDFTDWFKRVCFFFWSLKSKLRNAND